MTNKSIRIILFFIGLFLLITIGWYAFSFASDSNSESTAATSSNATSTSVPPSETPLPKIGQTPFDGHRAYADVETQVAFGPRWPGTAGHDQMRAWIQDEIIAAGWGPDTQASEVMGHTIYNLIAKNSDEPPQIIIGAHYDSRMYADNDPDPTKHTEPVPAANDGASGVSVLLELARVLPKERLSVWLVFFDAEDNGRIEGWDWILGSREFVKNNPSIQPKAVVVVDMIGDADLNIYRERNSNAEIMDEIWAVAKILNYEDRFLPGYKWSMTDDHTPFLEAGLPAVDLIDFDYPYWHTTQDTPDKVSAESLQVVGDILYTWIIQKSMQ